ncbi:hypothetical protein Q7689_26690, partial [Nocardiopsis tropica]|nr:hypothetical protein [Nocardiopsis tropica]
MITAADETMIELFSELPVRQSTKPIRQLRREGTDPPRKGRPWKPTFEDRVLLMPAYWRTDLTTVRARGRAQPAAHWQCGI